MSFVVGLTGPSGAGKTSVTEIARGLGYKVIDCDSVARNAALKGSEGLKALVKAFGKGILNADGSLNRAALAKSAFSSTQKTELLNETILPYIVRLITPQLDSKKVLLDAPTLFESGVDSICNVTVAVLADTNFRLQRIINRDNLDESAARLRISAGKSDDFYKSRVDYVLYNNDEIDAFLASAESLFKKITEENSNE